MSTREPVISDLSLKDGTRLRVLRWAAAAPTKNVLLIQHGIGEHGGRYQTYVDELAALPLDIWAFDARGHGRSEGPRGHAALGITTLADDLSQVIAHVLGAVPGARLFVAGHSLGAAIVGQYATTRTPDPAIQGFILSAPPVKVNKDLVMKVKLAIGGVLGSVVPKLTMPTGLSPDSISSVPAEVKRYKEDPLVHDLVSAALGVSTIKDAEALLGQAHKIVLPVLLFHGADDPLVSVEGSRALKAVIGSRDLTYREFPGAKHETHHETAETRAALFGLMKEWLTPRLSA